MSPVRSAINKSKSILEQIQYKDFKMHMAQ